MACMGGGGGGGGGVSLNVMITIMLVHLERCSLTWTDFKDAYTYVHKKYIY